MSRVEQRIIVRESPTSRTKHEIGRRLRPSTPYSTTSRRPLASPGDDYSFTDDREKFDFRENSDKSSSTAGKKFHFEEKHDGAPPAGCIGISIGEIFRSFQSPKRDDSDASLSKPFFPGNLTELGSILQQTVKPLKSLNCQGTPSSVNNHSFSSHNFDHRGIVSFLSDSGTFDVEVDHSRRLLQRAASWSTLETAQTPASRATSTFHSKASHTKREIQITSPTKQVQFQYPPITSLRLRPRTESDEIKKLFFAAEELEQMEDDRLDTKAADDVETLVVGESDEWHSMPSTTSTATTSADDPNSSLLFLGENNDQIYHGVGANVRSAQRSSGDGERRFVRGVQIMLREKSLG